MNRDWTLKPTWAGLAFFILFLFTWEMAFNYSLISRLFFPAPTQIALALYKLILDGRLVLALGATLTRFMVGLVLGSMSGALIGLMMGWWPRLYELLNPFVSAIYPVPKIAIFPLLMVIFGIGEGSKFAAITLAAFFPMLINGLAGVRQINKVYFEVGQNYGARGLKVLTHILFPGSLPSLLAGLRLAANMSLVITISVEIVTANKGLGVLLWFGWQTLRVAELYSVVVVVSFMGILLSFFFDKLFDMLVPWIKN